MSLAQRFMDSSERMIARYGTNRNYNRIIGEQYNVDLQQMVTQTQTLNVKMFKTEPKEREVKSPNLINRETTAMLVAAKSLPFKPKLGDTISEAYLDDMNTFRVESVHEIWAGESVTHWRLICTKS